MSIRNLLNTQRRSDVVFDGFYGVVCLLEMSFLRNSVNCYYEESGRMQFDVPCSSSRQISFFIILPPCIFMCIYSDGTYTRTHFLF